jgi:hypothetical protein
VGSAETNAADRRDQSHAAAFQAQVSGRLAIIWRISNLECQRHSVIGPGDHIELLSSDEFDCAGSYLAEQL